MMFFGKSRTLPSQADLPLTLPGIISGYGGGTFDGQGHQVTPPQQTMARDDGRADPANPAVPAKIIQHILAQSGALQAKPAMQMPGSKWDDVSTPYGGPRQPPAGGSVPGPQAKQPGFFHHGIGDVLRNLAGGALDGVSTYYGGKPGFYNASLDALKQSRDMAKLRQTMMMPFTIGHNRLQFDPSTGKVATLYHGNADFQDYAAAQGFEPGTPEYTNAAQDFILRGNGRSAMEYDQQLDDTRTDNRVRLEGVQQDDRMGLEQSRQAGRTGLEGMRQRGRMGLEGARQGDRIGLEGIRQTNRMGLHGAPTYRDTHGLPPRQGGGRGSMPSATGANGQKIHYDAGQGKWIDQNGRPVG